MSSDKVKAHQKSRRQKRKIKSESESTAVKSLEDTIIPTESVKTVAVQLNFPAGSDSAYIEKIFISNRGEEEIYASPDSLISREDSSLKISNFSRFPVRIHEGQVLGYAHNPAQWLDSTRNLTPE